MKKITKSLVGLTLISGLLFALPALAATNPSGTGQPNASCEEEPNSPPGFGTAGFANAQTHYAGSPGSPSALHSNSTHAVSQYDVACYQVSNKH